MNFYEKEKEIKTKYNEPIGAISEANHVDMDIAYSMFKANVTKGAKYSYKSYKEAEELAKKDFEELHRIAESEVMPTAK